MRRIKLGIAAVTVAAVSAVGLATAPPASAAGTILHLCITIRPNPPICIDI